MHRKSQGQFYSLPFKKKKILKSRIDYSFSVIWIP